MCKLFKHKTYFTVGRQVVIDYFSDLKLNPEGYLDN